MSEEEAAPVEAPGLLALLEDSLRVLFAPGAVFEAHRFAPPPGFGAMTGVVLVWAAAALLVQLLMALMTLPATAAIGPLPASLALLGGLLLALVLGFAGAGVILALSALSGGKGGYERSYQLLALLSPLLAVASAALWVPVPYLSLVPTLLGAFLFARGLSELHEAPGVQSTIVVGALTVVLLAGQILMRPAFERAQRQAELAANLYSTASGLASGMSALQQAAGPAGGEPGATGTPVQPVPDLVGAATPDSPLTPLTGSSSVDMVQGMSEGQNSGLPLVQPGRQLTAQDVQQMRETGLNMLDNVSQKLHDPAMMKNVPPEQAEQLKQVTQLMDQMRTGMRDPNLTPADRQRMMQQAMQMLGNLQGSAPQQQGPRRKKIRVPEPGTATPPETEAR
ncbi:MAG: Yip1 family protein [Elusimicrobiota bacterium]|jgi:hypothetical protein